MPNITINIISLMKEKGFTTQSLAQMIGIAPNNLSNIIHNNVREVKLETLAKLCQALNCNPGDILEYKERKQVILLFLDYSGTTDHLLKGQNGEGAENTIMFFDSINEMQKKFNCEVQITLVTGTAYESTKSKYRLLKELAENAGYPNLFTGAVAEYCGFWINGDKTNSLKSLDPRLLEKRLDIEQIVRNYGGTINPRVTTYYNVIFNENTETKEAREALAHACKEDGIFDTEFKLTRKGLSTVCKEVGSLNIGDDIETLPYFDTYGKEFDIKPNEHTKSLAVEQIVESLKNRGYDIHFVVIGGDSQEEDLSMYKDNIEKFNAIGIPSYFIAPSNIGEIQQTDPNVIIAGWENALGITKCIEKITASIELEKNGGAEYVE